LGQESNIVLVNLNLICKTSNLVPPVVELHDMKSLQLSFSLQLLCYHFIV